MTSLPYPVLYSFRRCPYAMRARLALLVSGQVCELREVVLARKPAALREASAKGTVPVLIDRHGQVIAQSLDIMLWALRQNDPRQWLQVKEVTREQMWQWVARCDGEFKFHLDRYKYPTRFSLTEAAEHQAKGAEFLSDLNRQLSEHHHLGGERACLADAAIAPFVRQFSHTDPNWFASQPWPALQAWLAAFENSAEFQQIMLKQVPWQAGQAPVLFPAIPHAGV